MSKLTEKIIDKLENDDWVFDEYTATHDSGIELLTGHGRWMLQIWRPTKLNFSLWDGNKVWKAVQNCRERMILRILEKKVKSV